MIFHTYTAITPPPSPPLPPPTSPSPTPTKHHHNPTPTPFSLSPSPSPSPTPKPLPFPAPTPLKTTRSCCVYLSTNDYVTKNCVSFARDCPNLEGWLLTSVEKGEENCRSHCFSPSPSPTPMVKVPPTPTPTPAQGALNFQCCWYISADHKKVCASFNSF